MYLNKPIKILMETEDSVETLQLLKKLSSRGFNNTINEADKRRPEKSIAYLFNTNSNDSYVGWSLDYDDVWNPQNYYENGWFGNKPHIIFTAKRFNKIINYKNTILGEK